MTVCLSSKQMLQITPHADPRRVEALLPALEHVWDKYNISTPERIAAFIAQCAHETQEWHRFREIWDPERVPQQHLYERPILNGAPEPFARVGEPMPLWQVLGNTEKGDGYRFRGGGLIHVTGRRRFQAAGDVIGMNLVAAPELTENDLAVACEVAGWYWRDWHGARLNRAADRKDFAQVTLLVNGRSTDAFRLRFVFYKRACALLGVPIVD